MNQTNSTHKLIFLESSLEFLLHSVPWFFGCFMLLVEHRYLEMRARVEELQYGSPSAEDGNLEILLA